MKCACLHCGGNIEFDADAAGQETPCPHCAKQTWIDDPTRFTAASPEGAKKTFAIKDPFKPQPKEETFFDRYWIALTVVLVLCLISAIGASFQNSNHLLGFVFGFGSALLGIGLIILAIFIYFLPAITAHRGKKKNYESILTLNFFLGWTVVGWVIALAWAQLQAPLEK